MKSKLVILLLLLGILVLPLLSANAGVSLDYFGTARFDRSYPVYTGPGEYYSRSNNGKATYGAGGVARIYGAVCGWLMIGYELGSGDYRIGYITDNAASTMYDLKGSYGWLDFTGYSTTASKNFTLTDDPIIKNKPILDISPGTAVTVLGSMGTAWTYVEVMGPSYPMRGFIRNFSGGSLPPQEPEQPVQAPNTYYHDYGKGEYLPSFQHVRLERSYEVYSGPGVHYHRANQGKAVVGGGVIRLYGAENDWALIGYELNNGDYRLGYIPLSAIPQLGLQIPYLDLQSYSITVHDRASLTDDIVMSNGTVIIIPAGTSVTFLGRVGTEWVYIQTMTTSYMIRGFVRASKVY